MPTPEADAPDADVAVNRADAGADDVVDAPTVADGDAAAADDGGVPGSEDPGAGPPARRPADSTPVVVAMLLAAAGLAALPFDLLAGPLARVDREVVLTVGSVSVVSLLVLTAAAVAHGSRMFLAVMSGIVVLWAAGFVTMLSVVSGGQVLDADAAAIGAQLAGAVLGVVVAWADLARRTPARWPGLVVVALAPVAGVLAATQPWISWDPAAAADLAATRIWVVAAVLAAGLICLPRTGIRLTGVLFVAVAAAHIALPFLQGLLGPDLSAYFPEELTTAARTLQLGAAVPAVVWGLAAAAPPRRPAVAADDGGGADEDGGAEDEDGGSDEGGAADDDNDGADSGTDAATGTGTATGTDTGAEDTATGAVTATATGTGDTTTPPATSDGA